MLRTLVPAALVAVTTLTAAPAAASVINVDRQSTSTFGETAAEKWRVITQFSVDGNESGLVYAGAFRLKSDASGALSEFLAFCLQPLEHLSLPKEYAIGSLFSETVNENLNTLAANAWDLVTDSTSAGAFQMAAWEITTETQRSFGLEDGVFQMTSNRSDSNAAEALAETWLGNLNNDFWTNEGDDYVILNATGTQDLLTNVAAVPLPASGLLLLGGLFGAGAVARRKKNKA